MDEGTSRLSETDELLIMKYHDGECGWLESRRVKRLLGRPDAKGFLDHVKEVGKCACECGAGEECEPVDLWERVERRIIQEESALELLGASSRRRLKEWSEGLLFHPWLGRVGWGVSGALVTASIGLLVLDAPRGSGGEEAKEPARFASSGAALPSVAPVSYGAERSRPRRFPSSVEVDWIRSDSGRLQFIEHPEQRSTIIWVKRKASQPRALRATPVVNQVSMADAH
jgi:hypothetical protein